MVISLVGNRTETCERIFNNKFWCRLYPLRPSRLKVQHADLINQGNALRFRP